MKLKPLKAGEFCGGNVLKQRHLSPVVLSEVVHRQGIKNPKHSHKNAYFALLLKGSYSENVGRHKFSCNDIKIFWRKPDLTHKDRVGLSGGHFFTIEVRSDHLENLKQYAPIPENISDSDGHLQWLAFRLYREFKNWQICSEMTAEGITLEMLAFLMQNNKLLERQRPKWLLRLENKLRSEFAQNLTTRELAAEANVHPVYMASVFRQFHHQTVGEYIKKLRVKHACQLLSNNRLTIVEIALLCGFSDQSHFTRIFKAAAGITPGEFRKEIIK